MDRPPQLLSITNFYPRPPRGGRLVHIIPAANLIGISIHALREEGDHKLFIHTAVILNFYPRPPRGGRPRSKSPTQFQCNFYPRPPRGGRPSARQTGSCRGIISIHALREEGDVQTAKSSSSTRRFLSTPSARRATCPPPPHNRLLSLFLSTPSARRATYLGGGRQPRPADFYPRPPRGGRRVSMVMLLSPSQFLSTPSARRATSEPGTMQTSMSNFYPRPPRGGRPAQC